MRSIPAGGKRAVTSLDHHREHLHQLTWQRRQPGARLSCRLVRTNAAAKSTGQGPRLGLRHSAGRNLAPQGSVASWDSSQQAHSGRIGYHRRGQLSIGSSLFICPAQFGCNLAGPLSEPVELDHGFALPGGTGRGRPIWPMLRYMMPPSGFWIRQMSTHAHLGR